MLLPPEPEPLHVNNGCRPAQLPPCRMQAHITNHRTSYAALSTVPIAHTLGDGHLTTDIDGRDRPDPVPPESCGPAVSCIVPDSTLPPSGLAALRLSIWEVAFIFIPLLKLNSNRRL